MAESMNQKMTALREAKRDLTRRIKALETQRDLAVGMLRQVQYWDGGRMHLMERVERVLEVINQAPDKDRIRERRQA